MPGDIHEILLRHYETLNTQYEDNFEAVRELQKTLILQILPGLVDELSLDEQDQQYALEWLQDTPSLFRTLRRHKFINSFALEALRDNLAWRCGVLKSLGEGIPSAYLYCLPFAAHDPFGRPILVLRLAPLCSSNPDLKTVFLVNMELLRLHLAYLNQSEHRKTPILQYAVLLDICGMDFHNVQQNVELLGWFVRELTPRFPGMISSVFVMNYSWAHTGIWNLAKRLLPAVALERVFFPSQKELQSYIPVESLPSDFGGDLPPLLSNQSSLSCPTMFPTPPASASCSASSSSIPDSNDTQTIQVPRTALSSTSLQNPYFGYPVLYGLSSAPTLRHGRRRKRDLVRTLLRLWWSRWKHPIEAASLVLLLVLAFWFKNKRLRHR